MLWWQLLPYSLSPVTKLRNNLIIELKKDSNTQKINQKIDIFLNNNLEQNKIAQARIFFIKSVEELIKKGNDVYEQGGNMTFERIISHENISITVRAKFLKNESLLSKMMSFFKK